LGVVAVKKVKITDENSFLQITNEISTLVDMMKGEAGAHPHLVSLVEVSYFFNHVIWLMVDEMIDEMIGWFRLLEIQVARQ